jgi:hypothetical protein
MAIDAVPMRRKVSRSLLKPNRSAWGHPCRERTSWPMKRLRQNIKTIYFLLLSSISATVLAQSNNVGTFRFPNRKGGHAASVVFRTARFKRPTHSITLADQLYLKKHRITASKEVSLVTKVDGRAPCFRAPSQSRCGADNQSARDANSGVHTDESGTPASTWILPAPLQDIPSQSARTKALR